MDQWDLRIVRAAVLHDLADFVPENHYANAVPGIERGAADWKLGKMLSKANPAMTMRQASATQVLIFLGLYEATNEALEHCENARKKISVKHPDLEAAHLQLTGYLRSVEWDLSTFMHHYVLHLQANEAAPLLSLINKTWSTDSAPQTDIDGGSTVGQSSDIPQPLQSPVDTGREKIAEEQSVAESTQDIYALFDPLNQEGIAKLFNKISESDWKERFRRAARNGLEDARQENRRHYNPAKVGEWLVAEGYYTQDEVDRKLGNNLPHRSKHMKYLFTGELD